MSIVDLIKATVVCGGGSVLVYTFPALGQAVVICLLALLWLVYARSTFVSLRRH